VSHRFEVDTGELECSICVVCERASCTCGIGRVSCAEVCACAVSSDMAIAPSRHGLIGNGHAGMNPRQRLWLAQVWLVMIGVVGYIYCKV
jgi:hypothetical protein